MAGGTSAQDAGEKRNILALSQGAVLLTAPSTYGDKWWPLYIMDGTARSGWASAKGQTRNHAFVIELAQRYSLRSLAIDNTGTDEKDYPGVSARTIELWTSTVANGGFTKAATFEAMQGGRREFTLPAPVEAQWVKLVVVDNWSNADYTELMEAEAFGDPVGPPPARQPIAGVFDTNYNALRLAQTGNTILGCYVWNGGAGFISGASDGRTINATWDEPRGGSGRRGVVTMILNAQGNFVNGIWYAWVNNDPAQGTGYGGIWHGTRGKERRTCVLPGEDALGKQIDQAGRAILYGIHFATDSAELQGNSVTSLTQVASLMRRRPGLRLRIEGHTDSTNTDHYNLDLSRRRAESVVRWLGQNGIASTRLEAEGFGKQKPVADNATAQGRALNRRVEISVLR